MFLRHNFKILNSSPSERNKLTLFYRGRSLLVASLSVGVHVLVYVSINFEWLPWNCKHTCPVHTTPEKFEKGVNHAENNIKCFPCTRTLLEKFENATITGHFGFVFKEVMMSWFWKSSTLEMFSVHIKTRSQCFQIRPRV